MVDYKTLLSLCKRRVNEVLDPTMFEVISVFGGVDSEGRAYCVVDFRRKDYSPEIECEEYCDIAVQYFSKCDPDDYVCIEREYKECVDTCKENLKLISTGSIKFDPITLTVLESTIPTSCDKVWGEGMTPEEFEEMEREFERRIEEYGCKPQGTSWIHPHEIVPVEVPELGFEEYPAVCYYHVKGCNLRSLVRLIDKEL